jgi:signal transduction histidine kinase
VKVLRFIRFGRSLFLLAALCLPAFSQPKSLSLSFQYTRTLWRVPDGLPEDTVQSLAESSDGLLWIGTTGGLARFDGSRLQPYGHGLALPLAGNSIFCLTFSKDGSLWAGTEGGGLLQLKGSVLTTYSVREGLTDGFVRSIFEDDQRRLWVGTDDGLFVMEDHHLQRIDQGSIAPIAVHSITQDREHRIWAGGSRLISITPDGREREYALPGAYSQNRVKRVIQTSDGTIWVGTVGGLQRLQQDKFVAVPGIHATVRTLLETSPGILWIGTIGDGLWTLRNDRLTQVSHAGLLPSDTVLTLLEDSLKQIWVGTQAGLVRLNKTAVSVVALSESGDPDFETISGDVRGDVWVAAQSLYLIRNGTASSVTYGGLRNITVRNVYRARDGALWIGTDGSGVYRIADENKASGITHYTAPNDLTNNFIRGFLEARDGSMWIATDEGVSRIGMSGPKKFTEANGLAFFSTRSLLEAADGSVWIGTDRGLSHWMNGHFEQDIATRTLAQDKVWSILQDRTGTLWFGTRDHGLFRYQHGGLQTFTTAEGLPSNSVYQILQDKRGTFWLTGPNTIASIAEQQMEAATASSDSPLRVSVYDMPFGAEGAQMYGGRQPSGYVASDNSVWFPTSRGAAHITGASLEQGPAPRAIFDDVVEDGRSATLSDHLHVAANIARLRFDFSAVSLRSQEGIRFRYKLEDFDRTWNTPAEDLSATYTNLPAGHYLLRVVAFDTAHPNQISEATLPFSKAPFIYQTWWFYTLLALTLIALGWIAYRIRVLRIRRQFAAVLAERNRLAREMHDTVIQGCAGISALLEAIASTSSSTGSNSEGTNHELLEFARQQARTTIDEARQAVWNMRHDQEKDVDLIEAIQGVATQTMREFGTEVLFTANVKPYRIGVAAAHEILMTVREAVYNSVQHSRANSVQVDLHVAGESLTVNITDQGVGFIHNPESPLDGHYGLVGMQERVQRLGGVFDLKSSSETGTRIKLKVRVTGRPSHRE